MNDLITRKAVLDALGEPHPMDYNACSAVHRVKSIPAVDAVPVVRCGECGKYAMLSHDQTQVMCRGVWHEKGWYCADGERQEEPHEDQT